MGNICPFLPREGEAFQNCISDKCFLYNKPGKSCVLSTVDLTKPGNIKLIQDSISASSQSTNDLIKKIGGLLTKTSKPLLEYIDAMKNGKYITDTVTALQQSLQSNETGTVVSSAEVSGEFVRIRETAENILETVNRIASHHTSFQQSAAVSSITADYKTLIERVDNSVEGATPVKPEAAGTPAPSNEALAALVSEINDVNKTAFKGLFNLIKSTMEEQNALLRSLKDDIATSKASGSSTVQASDDTVASSAALAKFEPIIEASQKVYTAVMDVSNALFETKEEIMGIHNNLRDFHTESQTQIRTFMENVHEWMQTQGGAKESTGIAELHETIRQMIKNFGTLGVNIAQIEQKILDKQEETSMNSAKIGKAAIETIAKIGEHVASVSQTTTDGNAQLIQKLDALTSKLDDLIVMQKDTAVLAERFASGQEKTNEILQSLAVSLEGFANGQDVFRTDISTTVGKMQGVLELQERYMQQEESGYKLRKAEELAVTAVALMLDKDLNGAIQKSKEAIELNPKLWGAYNTLGMALAESGESKKAVEVFKKLINQNADFSEAYYNLGVLLARDKEFEKAIGLYKLSIEKNTTFAKAYVALGDALEETGATDGALKAWERAVQMDPTLDEIREKVSKYREINS